jgi:hypothetical protein
MAQDRDRWQVFVNIFYMYTYIWKFAKPKYGPAEEPKPVVCNYVIYVVIQSVSLAIEWSVIVDLSWYTKVTGYLTAKLEIYLVS